MNDQPQMCLAKFEDLPSICDIFGRAMQVMQNIGVDYMITNYPSSRVFEDDIRNKYLYILKINRKIVGFISLIPSLSLISAVIRHKEVDFREKHLGKSLYIRRCIVDPNYERKGFGKELLKFAEFHCINKGFNAIRLGTLNSPLNLKAIKFYERNGYELKKIVHNEIRNDYVFVYEKVFFANSKL